MRTCLGSRPWLEKVTLFFLFKRCWQAGRERRARRDACRSSLGAETSQMTGRFSRELSCAQYLRCSPKSNSAAWRSSRLYEVECEGICWHPRLGHADRRASKDSCHFAHPSQHGTSPLHTPLTFHAPRQCDSAHAASPTLARFGSRLRGIALTLWRET